MSEQDIGWWGEITRTRRRMIFFYNLVWLLILGLIGLYLINIYCPPDENSVAATCFLPSLVKSCSPLLTKFKMFINCMWMGALGGVTISLKGVYEHGNPKDPWSNAYNLWHIGRPFSGAVAGVIVALLFVVVFPTTGVSRLVLYGVAFIFGTQDAAFFTFLSEFASRFVKTSKPGPAGVRINAVTPPRGTAGDIVTIVGQGFEADATVKIGSVKIDKYTMTADGTTISGAMPPLPGLAAGDHVLDVIVMNPNGTSAAAVGKFTFVAP